MKCTTVVCIALSVISLTCGISAFAQSSAPTSTSAAQGATSYVPISNVTLRRQVKAALKMTKGLTSFDIAVRVKNGQVTLQGTVKSQQQIDLAGKVASEVPGVTSVKNSVTVNRPNNSWR
nr:BON domain-containing protein [Burkholderia ambifaria]